jgi:5'-methylthioadenosine phosphorylase
MNRIGIIGGSGLYDVAGLATTSEVSLATPYGDPSDEYLVGELSGIPVAFLARHGRKHVLLPTELNYRANIWGFKTLGCDALISASACGSMKEHIHPGDLVLPDQFIDRTTRRVSTFFGDGCVAHVSLAHPICPHLLETLDRAGRDLGIKVHSGGVYLGIEGPQFSTRAESLLYRSWGVDVIGMTNIQEARLCREAEMCYSTMAFATDYDCWNEDEQAVTVQAVIEVLSKNADAANRLLTAAVKDVKESRTCTCREALKNAVLTRPQDVPEKTKRRLGPLMGKYWS